MLEKLVIRSVVHEIDIKFDVKRGKPSWRIKTTYVIYELKDNRRELSF